MEPHGELPAWRLGALVEEECTEIERRWIRRVEAQTARTPGVEPTLLRAGLPDYLKALVDLLQGRLDVSSDAEPAWSKVAREHGITRVRIGFDIKQLIQEFVTLRQVIREVALERGLAIEAAESVLSDALDGAIAAAVSAYVDARDYQARQKEAENIGFLTHELRNPLSTAIMAASRLRRDAAPEQLPMLDMLDRSQKRLCDLIDSVLLTERMEVGRVECKPTEVRLRQIMEPALEAARATATHKGLRFEARYDPELVVEVDPTLTRSAVQNLADNAAKYTDHGAVEISVDESPEQFVVHVRDTCEGISEAELRTIFEPFRRGTTGKSGTGLGLAIARRAAQLQGGSIDAESGEPWGCHFWMALPRRARVSGSSA